MNSVAKSVSARSLPDVSLRESVDFVAIVLA
jgi:hypothetical protein